MGVITFDGISSSSLGVTVEGYSSAPMAEKDVEKVHVPGRSGDLIIDNGSFLNYNQKYTMHWLKNNHNRTAITSWLYKDGYKKFVDDYDNEHFRMAHFVGGVPIDSRMDVLDRAVFEFDFKPQRFLNSGDEWVPFTMQHGDNSSITNDTNFTTKPLLLLTNATAGTKLYINHAEIDILTAGTLYIDCETQKAYYGVGDRDSWIRCENFPELKPGENSITFTGGIQLLRIKPRWWEL